MKNAVIYVHGQNGTIAESKPYNKFFDDSYDVIGFDYKSRYPWDAKEEFRDFFDTLENKYKNIVLVANSMGAYFSLISLNEYKIEKAFFISPIVDMEKLILDMMKQSNVKEEELYIKKEIKTSFDEPLSWKYLSYVREIPIIWNIPTFILYGEKDHLVSLNTITNFADKINAKLTILTEGEHWFHTKKQMEYLDKWMIENRSI